MLTTALESSISLTCCAMGEVNGAGACACSVLGVCGLLHPASHAKAASTLQAATRGTTVIRTTFSLCNICVEHKGVSGLPGIARAITLGPALPAEPWLTVGPGRSRQSN